MVFSGSRGGWTDRSVVNTDGPGLRQLTNDRHGDLQPAWSPDGSWVAWSSERNVLNLTNLDLGRWQISLDGGREPRWSADGRELFYWAGSDLMVVRVMREGELPAFGAPARLFGIEGTRLLGREHYDLAADGRFLMVEIEPQDFAEPAARAYLIEDWVRTLGADRHRGP